MKLSRSVPASLITVDVRKSHNDLQGWVKFPCWEASHHDNEKLNLLNTKVQLESPVRIKLGRMRQGSFKLHPVITNTLFNLGGEI